MKLSSRARRINRSTGGDIFIFVVLGIAAAFMALPLVYAVSNAFKPLNELFLFPPQFFVRNPTLDNFRDLFVLMGNSWVPFSRYAFNTLLITLLGTAGHVILASLGAYAVAKFRFPGRNLFSSLVLISLMFAPQVTAVPNYLVMSRLGWIDTYLSIIVPAWGMSLGFYLMSKFMGQIPDDLLWAARVDGASELLIFWRIVMPYVKPAWLTLVILSFQQMWGTTGGRFIYSEELKTLPYALQQIVAGGIARAGVSAAVGLIMMIIPITIFVFNQSRVVETMGTSGID